jgi:ABC-type phosphate transport system substrate-binding protein
VDYVLSAIPSAYRCNQFEDHVVALDGVAIVVNSYRSCATTLLKEDLLRIWQGGYPSPLDFSRIPNPVQQYRWKDIFPGCLGQPFEDELIIPVAPVVGSGNRTTLATLLGVSHFGPNNGWPAEEATITHIGVPRLSSAMTMLIDIRSNPNHIGYVPLGYMSGVRALALDCSSFGARLGCEEGSSSLPTKENIQNGNYPLGRNLHLLAFPQTLNPRQVIQDYLGWISGPMGQAIVENVGYMPNFPASEIPPNWDINADHIVDGFDVGIIGGYWNHGGPLDLQDPVYPIVRGWTRADISFDGKVDALDISNLSAYWNRTW